MATPPFKLADAQDPGQWGNEGLFLKRDHVKTRPLKYLHMMFCVLHVAEGSHLTGPFTVKMACKHTLSSEMFWHEAVVNN